MGADDSTSREIDLGSGEEVGTETEPTAGSSKLVGTVMSAVAAACALLA